MCIRDRPYAIDHGLVKAEEPYTTVRIHQVNTNSIINAKVAVKDGRAVIEGDLHIDGVPTLGSTIELDFSDSVGGITGKLLPTGNVTDTITTEDGKQYEVSVVDAGTPTVFIRAESLGMQGTETPAEIEGDAALMARIEEIRGRCAEKIGLTDTWQNATKKCPVSYTHLSREDADVDYTFGQVSFVDAKVDYKSNCGNISAGVGPYAIDHGLVKAEEPYTTVRIHQVNTNSIINAKVAVKDGRAVIELSLIHIFCCQMKLAPPRHAGPRMPGMQPHPALDERLLLHFTLPAWAGRPFTAWPAPRARFAPAGLRRR